MSEDPDIDQTSSPTVGSGTSAEKSEGDLFILSALTLAAGAVTGLVAAAFRLALEQAGVLRDRIIEAAHSYALGGFLAVLLLTAAAAACAAFLVRRFSPHASGSGIPHVEAVLYGKARPANLMLVPVKFGGGLLAIGSGLLLGREGPSVQMGAALSMALGRLAGRSGADCRVLLAAGAGAGLATAFNAPIAGAVFVLEELVQRFESRIAISGLGAAASAVTVAHLMSDNAPDFQVQAFSDPGPGSWPLFMALGLASGVLGVAYNRTILGSLALADSMKTLPVEARAALVGALVAMVAWYAPGLVGGGDDITQHVLSGEAVLAVVPMIFAVRFGLGAISYASGTPGGLFAPMLVLGSQIGYLFGALCRQMPMVNMPATGFAVVGMAAFFAGVVRAPLTGIILVSEMTGSMTLLLPMVFASFTSMMVAAMLRDRPIYEALRDRTAAVDARLKHRDEAR